MRLVYTLNAGTEYWPDDRYYSFTTEEIELLIQAGKDVFEMCCEAAEVICRDPTTMTKKMAIPEFAVEQIIRSWDREPACGSVYGRFDKRNLNEAEKVLGHAIKCVYFTASSTDTTGEDAINTAVLMDACSAAVWSTESIFLQDIQFSLEDKRFYDKVGKHIDVIFKLWPWEWMVEEDKGEQCFKDMVNIGEHAKSREYVGGTVWLEAPYKMLWSNKALFPILWDMFKDDPRGNSAAKPSLLAKGLISSLKDGEQVIQDTTTGDYGKEGYIVQELCQLPMYEDAKGNPVYAVLGVWFIDGDPSGMGIREDATPVTTNTSTFVPHSISDGGVRYERKAVPTLGEIDKALTITEEERQTPEYLDIVSSAQGLFPEDGHPYCIVRAGE
ncbi:hypothetical protein V2G26_000216 [Clonostachys chloroleuca]